MVPAAEAEGAAQGQEGDEERALARRRQRGVGEGLALHVLPQGIDLDRVGMGRAAASIPMSFGSLKGLISNPRGA